MMYRRGDSISMGYRNVVADRLQLNVSNASSRQLFCMDREETGFFSIHTNYLSLIGLFVVSTKLEAHGGEDLVSKFVFAA